MVIIYGSNFNDKKHDLPHNMLKPLYCAHRICITLLPMLPATNVLEKLKVHPVLQYLTLDGVVHQEKPHLKILYNSALSCRILHQNVKTDMIMQMFQIFQIFQITSLHQNGLKDFPNFAEFFGI